MLKLTFTSLDFLLTRPAAALCFTEQVKCL
jgi:hypothetical protein